MQTGNGARGNVLFIVLIGIALFALLSFAVTRMDGQQKPGLIAKVQAEDQIGRLLAQGGALTDAVRQMASNGNPALLPTADADFGLNTVTPGAGGWDTPPNEYKIYHPYGGGVKYIAQTGTGSTLSDEGNLANNFRISRGSIITGVGAGDALGDIVFTAAVSSESACQLINVKVRGTAPGDAPPALDDADFTTLITNGADTTVTGANCAGCVNLARACISNASGTAWGYYQVLLAQ